MARRKIGEATTDSHGIATFTYTGEGRGKLQIVAVQGALESEPQELYDCRIFDKGISSDNNSSAWTTSNNASLSYETNYAVIEPNSTKKELPLSETLIDGDTIEYDLFLSVDVQDVDDITEINPIYLNFKNNNITKKSIKLSYGTVPLNEWVHVKIECSISNTESIIKMTTYDLNAVQKGYGKWKIADSIINKFVWSTETIEEIRFKNFMLY